MPIAGVGCLPSDMDEQWMSMAQRRDSIAQHTDLSGLAMNGNVPVIRGMQGFSRYSHVEPPLNHTQNFC